MHTIHKTLRMLVIMLSLLSPLTTFNMRNSRSQHGLQSECSICGKKSASKTKGINKTITTWQKQRAYNSWRNIPTDDLDFSSISPNTSPYGSPYGSPHTTPSPRKEGSPRYNSPRQRPLFKNVPIYHVDECSHNVCIECVEKSKTFDPDDRGCRLCAYERARLQNTDCNIPECSNPADNIKQYLKHTHGLCNKHNDEIAKIHTSECNVCYAQKNFDILNQSNRCEICDKKSDHIDINASCAHHLCTTCKNASDTLSLDSKSCKQCTYKEAQIEHTHCNVNECLNPVHKITGHETHTHGLCNDHAEEIKRIHSVGCNVCYAKENPNVLDQLVYQLVLCQICEKNNAEHIDVNATCQHTICTTCKNESDMLLNTNSEGCKTCTYIDERQHHLECDIDTCKNPTAHISGDTRHIHGLCNEHNLTLTKLQYNDRGCKICYAQHNPALINKQQCESCTNNVDHININTSCTHHLCNLHNDNTMQFKYSPINFLKNRLQGTNCKTCFIQNNPEVTSCINKRQYWGEMALLAGATGIIIYSAKKMYTWWQERKEKQEHAQEELIHPESATVQSASKECDD